jgi:hypothetical protein
VVTIALVGAGLATGALHAVAQVIGDPLGLVSIGTANENTSATALAVSNGGSSSAYVAASNGGNATGVFFAAAVGGGRAQATTFGIGSAAVSPTGQAYGASFGVSGTGTSCASNMDFSVAISVTGNTDCPTFGAYGGPTLAISGTGNASTLPCSWPIMNISAAITVLGNATSCGLSVSGMGNATSTGCYLYAGAITVTGSASSCGEVTVSGTNYASGGAVAISGTKDASGTGRAFSGLGNSNACGDPVTGNQSISVMGNATACTSGSPVLPNGIALSGSGAAASTLASVSGTGSANDLSNACSEAAAVSAYGSACGSTATVAPNGTGASPISIDPNVDDLVPPTDIAGKIASAQALEAAVIQNLATYAVPAIPVRASASSSTASSVPPAVRHTWPIAAQQRWYWCGPASVENALIQMGAYDAGQAQFASDMGTNSTYGTNLNYMPGEINKWGWRQNHSRNPYAAQVPGSATQLMAWVTQNQTQYLGAPVIANVYTGNMPWFAGRQYTHYDLISGYDHYGGGHLDWAEEYNARQWGGNYNSFGDHFAVPLAPSYSWIHSSPTHGVVW